MSEAAFAAAVLAPEPPTLTGLHTWNGADPARRLAVHRNTMVVGLVDGLASSFAVVQALVGDEFFRAMATLFVRQHPPASPVLAWYGAAMPGFIDSFAAAAAVPCLADVARLEWLRQRATHAADAVPLTVDAIPPAVLAALQQPDRLAALRLHLHPSVGVLASRHAVVSVWAAHQGLGDLADVDVDQAEAAVVLRPQWQPLVLLLPPGAAAFVAALQAGLPLGGAASAALAAAPDFQLAQALTLLLQQGALTAMHLPDED